MHLCEECARDSGASKASETPSPGAMFTTSLISFGDKLSRSRGMDHQVTCPQCEMTYQEFRLKGRLGCLDCYSTFEEGLITLMEKVHGSSHHIGTGPTEASGDDQASATWRQELIELRRRLKREVKDENYEEAARVRDRIVGVEQKLTESHGD